MLRLFLALELQGFVQNVETPERRTGQALPLTCSPVPQKPVSSV